MARDDVKKLSNLRLRPPILSVRDSGQSMYELKMTTLHIQLDIVIEYEKKFAASLSVVTQDEQSADRRM
jgi:hypothetical protein